MLCQACGKGEVWKIMEKIKLGVIGMSPGNGHPYSWSAICNGYDMRYMNECPFPVIPQYLLNEIYPENFISGAEVAYIWTQDIKISEHVAKASRIKHVVTNPLDMLGKVDGILFARDDAENHLEMCRPFLEAGVMIYIDKPLAFDLGTANKIYDLQKFDGQIFSCSAMRYAKELEHSIDDIRKLGKLSYIHAMTMKSWDTYSAHIIDPLLCIIGDEIEYVDHMRIKNSNTQGLVINLNDGLCISMMAHRHSGNPIEIDVFGEKGHCKVVFNDTFYAFKNALNAFIESVKNKKSIIGENHVKKVVELIELGNGI